MANPTKKKNRVSKKRVFAMVLAGLLALLFLVPYVVQIAGYAASSQEVLDQLAQLQQNAVALDQQQIELQQTIIDTQSEAMDYVAQKAVIDQTIQVLQTRITNTQDQILEYNLLIKFDFTLTTPINFGDPIFLFYLRRPYTYRTIWFLQTFFHRLAGPF